jgi:hypothetical protein
MNRTERVLRDDVSSSETALYRREIMTQYTDTEKQSGAPSYVTVQLLSPVYR